MRASPDGRTVLVVEDDWLVRADMVLGLQQEGWTVLEAATGAGALKVLRENDTVDLLITDIGLADAMTGWDVAEAFRASRPMAPVIYASGGPNNDERQVPGSVFLSKPVVISRLLEACRQPYAENGRPRADVVDHPSAGALREITLCAALSGDKVVARGRAKTVEGAPGSGRGGEERLTGDRAAQHYAAIVEIVRRCDPFQRPRRRHHELEPRGPAAFWLHGRGGCRQVGDHAYSDRSARRRTHDPRTYPSR